MNNLQDWLSLNGKEIEAAYWPDTADERSRMIKYDVDCGIGLRLHAENCGDRLELWIVVTQHGEETFRHNLKLVESFAWRDRP